MSLVKGHLSNEEEGGLLSQPVRFPIFNRYTSEKLLCLLAQWLQAMKAIPDANVRMAHLPRRGLPAQMWSHHVVTAFTPTCGLQRHVLEVLQGPVARPCEPGG